MVNHADGLFLRLNPEGFPAFERPLFERYQQMLLTNTLGGTFYASKQQLLHEAAALHQAAYQADPAAMAQALVDARQRGLMRLQPISGLAYLSRQQPTLARAIFDRVILTPSDLEDYVAALGGKLTRPTKRLIAAWLNRLSEYHALKYAVPLRDLVRLTHPRPHDARQAALFGWLVDRRAWRKQDIGALTPQILAYERLQHAKRRHMWPLVEHWVTEGRLPYEIVTATLRPTPMIWRRLMRQMPYMALLRHLNTLQRYGLFNDPAEVDYVAKRLSDVEAMQRARVLSFRLWRAYQAFTPSATQQTAIHEALVGALDASHANMPTLGGRVCIAPDVSGSMSGRAAAGETRYIEIAGLFVAALLHQSAQATVLPFNDAVVPVALSAAMPTMEIVQRVVRLLAGGTALSAPISALLHEGKVVDTFIGITDNVEWAHDSYGNHGFLPTWLAYKQQVAPHARAFLITLAPYMLAPTPASLPDVHYIYGWNEQVLDYIHLMAH